MYTFEKGDIYHHEEFGKIRVQSGATQLTEEFDVEPAPENSPDSMMITSGRGVAEYVEFEVIDSDEKKIGRESLDSFIDATLGLEDDE